MYLYILRISLILPREVLYIGNLLTFSSDKMKLVTEFQGVVYPFVSIGSGRNALVAFDSAEVNAGIVALNAVSFTSFVPCGPGGRWKVSRDSRLRNLIKNGENLPMAHKFAYSSGEKVSAALAIGLNKDPKKPGIIMEYAKVGWNESDLVHEAVESVREVFSLRKKDGWELGKIIVVSDSIQSKKGTMNGILVGALYFPERYLKRAGLEIEKL